MIGGVTTTPLRTRKKFAADPSAMCPSAFSTIASSKPARIAPDFASAELT